MSRRLIAGLLALVSALIAGFLVLSYAASADRRAMADLSPTPVLVVTQPVPAGTPASALPDFVTVREVPEASVVAGGVGDLAEVEGQVTNADLVPGEQLLAARFSPPESADTPDFEIPAGFHRLTVQMEPRRVIGGDLKVGDRVGFFANVDGQTRLLLHRVLVTKVVGAAQEATEEQAAQGPAESLMITLALSATDAEKVVYVAEHHSIWLSLEPADAPVTDSGGITAESLFS